MLKKKQNNDVAFVMIKEQKKPELLSPAGDWNCLNSALDAGADAIYFGIKNINMRYNASNFDVLEMPKISKKVHERNKKSYLALNVVIYNKEIEKIKCILKIAKDSNIDGVILWDMSVMSIAKDLGLNIHLSTQASVSNIEAVKFYSLLGVNRIVLARECNLNDIKYICNKIKEEKINCEIETFIHGAMCVSISGRCFLSQSVFNKSANRGECIQPCRREYSIIDEDKECNYIVGKDYLLSPKDLCTIDIIDDVIGAGVNVLKIEGRMRSAEYVKIATSVYREAIDKFFSGKLTYDLKIKYKNKLKSIFNRGFTKGFYLGGEKDLGAKIEKTHEKVYIGEVYKFYKKIKVAEVFIRDKSLKLGQKILIIGKKTPASFFDITSMEINHKQIKEVVKGMKVGIKLSFDVKAKDKVFLWEKIKINNCE